MPWLTDPLFYVGALLVIVGLVVGYVAGYRDGRSRPLYLIATPSGPYALRVTVTHDFGPLAVDTAAAPPEPPVPWEGEC